MSRACSECNKHGTCAKERKVSSGKGWCSKFYQSRRSLEADRDRLASDLQATRAELEETRHDLAKFQRSERVLAEMLREKVVELERVRRNHLRRMVSVARMRGRHFAQFEDYHRSQIVRFVTACRAALATMETREAPKC